MENKILRIIKNNWENGALLSLCLWLLIWSGYNSNFWRVILPDFPNSTLDLIHGLRAYLPILAGLFAIVLLFSGKHFLSKRFFLTPIGLLLVYAIVGIISAFFSKDVFHTLYGDFMYGAVIVVLILFLYKKNSLKNISSTVNINWAIAGILTVMLITFFLIQPGAIESLAYNSLICGSRPYEGLGGVQAGADIFGMAGTRPTGLVRYAGVATLVCLAYFCFGKKKIKLFWLILFLFFLAMLIFSKGKTGIIGFLIAAPFIFMLGRKYKYFLAFGIFSLFFLIGTAFFYQPICSVPIKNVPLTSQVAIEPAATQVITESVKTKVDPVSFLTKNSAILTLSGRINGVWVDSWRIFLGSPLIGQGFQADKSLLTAHNTVLHALVQTGLLGTVPFVLAFLLTFLILVRLFKNPDILEKERYFLIVATSVLIFFVVRSITESMAIYSADWLFVAPIIAYVQFLDNDAKKRNNGKSASMNVLQNKIDLIETSGAIERIKYWIKNESQKLHWVVVTGMHGLVEAENHADFKRMLSFADLWVPDGISMVLLAKTKGCNLEKRVSGADLMHEFFKIAEKEGFSNYFYGDTDETLQDLNKKLLIDFPNLKIAGSCSPPFRRLTETEDGEIIERINRSKPDVLWVALGLPKQEKWIFEHREKLNVPVAIGVGAAFKFVSGKVRRAPKWIGNLGFEWLWRLFCEPKVTWKRIFIDGPIFWKLFLLDFFVNNKK